MTNLTTTKTNVPAVEADPFVTFAAESMSGPLFLKYVKGHYKYGTNAQELPLGTHLVANMPGLQGGYMKWADGAPDRVRHRIP